MQMPIHFVDVFMSKLNSAVSNCLYQGAVLTRPASTCALHRAVLSVHAVLSHPAANAMQCSAPTKSQSIHIRRTTKTQAISTQNALHISPAPTNVPIMSTLGAALTDPQHVWLMNVTLFIMAATWNTLPLYDP